MSEDGIDRERIYRRWNDAKALARPASPVTVTNTSARTYRERLASTALEKRRPVNVEEEEARGVSELLGADVLPVDGSDHPALAMIEWGESVPGDPLFRYAKLPPGWARRTTADPRSLELVDETGAVRASIFYKAAFYDRKADIHAVAPR